MELFTSIVQESSVKKPSNCHRSTAYLIEECYMEQYAKASIIGPRFFLEPALTAENNKRMVGYYSMPVVLDVLASQIFQQDGTPPHFLANVRGRLDTRLSSARSVEEVGSGDRQSHPIGLIYVAYCEAPWRILYFLSS